MFCRCDNNAFGVTPNKYICPICMGFPGALPSINKKAMEKAIKTALALNCSIPKIFKFDRKHYFYPDLPPNFQISQYDIPLSHNGRLEIKDKNGNKKTIRITRLHLECDAGKLVHEGNFTLCDYNRAGTPLMEIVTEPDLRSAYEARMFAETLQKILQHTGSSSADMYKGMMRFDASVSIKLKTEKNLRERAEIKNLNSFKALGEAIEYEVKRQIDLDKKGTPLKSHITVGWKDKENRTEILREKESAADYRYFPEPDLPPIEINKKYIKKLRKSLPELFTEKKERLQSSYSLSPDEARIISENKDLAQYFEEIMLHIKDYRLAKNLILTNLLGLLKQEKIDVPKNKIPPKNLIELINETEKGIISSNAAKQVLEDMYREGKTAKEIIKEKNLKLLDDDNKLEKICKETIKKNTDIVSSIHAGKNKAFGALVGQVMKKTHGKADPKKVNEILKKLIKDI